MRPRFETGRQMMDVTSMHRPDEHWKFVDAKGHEHQWHVKRTPAVLGEVMQSYDPNLKYDTPTLVWIHDGFETWEEDDEPHAVGHWECKDCGERVNPGYTADTHQQMIAGIQWWKIDGVNVTKEEYDNRLRKERFQ